MNQVVIRLRAHEFSCFIRNIAFLYRNLGMMIDEPVQLMLYKAVLLDLWSKLLNQASKVKPGKEVKLNPGPATCYVLYELFTTQDEVNFEDPNLVKKLIADIHQVASSYRPAPEHEKLLLVTA